MARIAGRVEVGSGLAGFSTRRGFIGGLTAFAAVGGRRAHAQEMGRYDDGLSILFSDAHVSGTEPEFAYTQDRLRAFVAAVVARNPLPRHVVFFGDLSRFFGKREDYAVAVPLLKPITDAGIDLMLGMGNHDRHETFREFFPEQLERSPVPGSVVSVVRLRDCDLVLLDSLNESAEGRAGDGCLCRAQQDWIAAEFPRWPRPFIVGAHHELSELKLGKEPLAEFLMRIPRARAYVGGHLHRWDPGWFGSYGWDGPKEVRRCVTLPSVGYWGDIGWVELRTTPGQAEITLRMDDFYVARPIGCGTGGPVRRPKAWDDLVSERQNAHCLIRLED